MANKSTLRPLDRACPERHPERRPEPVEGLVEGTPPERRPESFDEAWAGPGLRTAPVRGRVEGPIEGFRAPRGSGQATILLVEDEVRVVVPLVLGLQDEGFRVLHAADGHWGLQLARAAQPDLVLVGVRLPRMDGLTLCRAVRQASAVPILLLTARGQEEEQIRGLELGADGYLVKPFSFREMLARVRALLRRAMNGGSPFDGLKVPPLLRGDRIVVGDVAVDRASRQVWRSGRRVRLRRRELDLLGTRMEFAGEAVSRHELLDRVWGEDWIGDPRTLDVHICWLREKLDDEPASPRYIQTVHGYGYRFIDPATLNNPRRRTEAGICNAQHAVPALH